jgi:hypothetical protein
LGLTVFIAEGSQLSEDRRCRERGATGSARSAEPNHGTAACGLRAPAHLLSIESDLDGGEPDRLRALQALGLVAADAPPNGGYGFLRGEWRSVHDVVLPLSLPETTVRKRSLAGGGAPRGASRRWCVGFPPTRG